MTSSLRGKSLLLTPLKAGEEAGTSEVAVEEVPTDRGHEEGVHQAIKVDEEGVEISEAHPSTPPTRVVLQALPSLRLAIFCLLLQFQNLPRHVTMLSINKEKINHASNLGGFLAPTD